MTDPRIAQLCEWVEDIDRDITRLQSERATLCATIVALDADHDAVTTNPPAPVSSPALAAGLAPRHPARREPAERSTPPKKPKAQRNLKLVTDAAPASSGSKYDYARIAQVANAAAAAGTSVREAITELYPDISTPMAGWVVGEARRRGHQISKARQGASRPRAVETPAQAKPAHGRDYPEIAKHVIELRDSGVAVAPALAKLYKVPESTAKNWMTRCRDLGLVPKLVAALRVVEDHTTSDEPTTAVYDAAKVAEAYREATRTNHRPLQFVADTFGIDRAQATNWVRQARLDGALPSAAEPQLDEVERRRLLDMSKPEPVA